MKKILYVNIEKKEHVGDVYLNLNVKTVVRDCEYARAETGSTSKYEPRSEKTGLRGFRPGPPQTGLYNHTRWLEA